MTAPCEVCKASVEFFEFEFAPGIGVVGPLCLKCWWELEWFLQEKGLPGIRPMSQKVKA